MANTVTPQTIAILHALFSADSSAQIQSFTFALYRIARRFAWGQDEIDEIARLVGMVRHRVLLDAVARFDEFQREHGDEIQTRPTE